MTKNNDEMKAALSNALMDESGRAYLSACPLCSQLSTRSQVKLAISCQP
jgi:hypothetical protein